MSAGRWNTSIEQGADWVRYLLVADPAQPGVVPSLAGYAAKMQVRDRAGLLVVELSTDNGRIVLGPVTVGAYTFNVTLALTGGETEPLPAATPQNPYSFDVFLIPAVGHGQKLAAGACPVIPSVTRLP